MNRILQAAEAIRRSFYNSYLVYDTAEESGTGSCKQQRQDVDPSLVAEQQAGAAAQSGSSLQLAIFGMAFSMRKAGLGRFSVHGVTGTYFAPLFGHFFREAFFHFFSGRGTIPSLSPSQQSTISTL